LRRLLARLVGVRVAPNDVFPCVGVLLGEYVLLRCADGLVEFPFGAGIAGLRIGHRCAPSSMAGPDAVVRADRQRR